MLVADSGPESRPAASGRSTRSTVVAASESASSASTSVAGDAAPPINQEQAGAELLALVQRIEALGPSLLEDDLRAAARRVAALVVPRRAQGSAEGSESPPVPQQLSYAGAGGVLMLGDVAPLDVDRCSECSDAGSAASLAGDPQPAGGDEEEQLVPADDQLEREEQQRQQADDPRQAVEVNFDAVLDPFGPMADPWRDAWLEGAALIEAGHFTYGDAAGGQRDPRMGSGGGDSLGLAAHGRRMYCDYHDLRGGAAHACMAVDMLQQSRMAAIVEKQQRLRQRKPRDDPDGRQARHACYKGVIAWQWANPLGAEQRVRLPPCVVYRVRKLFPNPRCCGERREDGERPCDYLERCERNGHYTGFRTAEESRAAREGRFDQVEIL